MNATFERQAVNRMLGAGADVTQTFRQQILRINGDDAALVIRARRSFELNTDTISLAAEIERAWERYLESRTGA